MNGVRRFNIKRIKVLKLHCLSDKTTGGNLYIILIYILF